MNNRDFWSLVCALWVSIGCALAAAAQDRTAATPVQANAHANKPIEGEPITPASGFAMSPEALAAYSRAALDGNGTAAYRIFLHYNFALSDGKKSSYWQRIAAENGHLDSMYGVASDLIERGADDSCRRGKFWIQRMREQIGRPQSELDASAAIGKLESAFAKRCKGVKPEVVSVQMQKMYGSI